MVDERMLQTSVPCACEGVLRRGFGGCINFKKEDVPPQVVISIHKAGEHEVVEERAGWGGGGGGGAWEQPER
jgi:hypothetical protein